MANFLCWNFGKIFRGVVGKENVTICGGFTRRSQENCLKIYWNSYSSRTCRIWADNNQLGLRPRWLYISSYPARPRRITVKYHFFKFCVANLHCECQELKPKAETNSLFLVLHPSSGVHTVNTAGSHLKCTVTDLLDAVFFVWALIKARASLPLRLDIDRKRKLNKPDAILIVSSLLIIPVFLSDTLA